MSSLKFEPSGWEVDLTSRPPKLVFFEFYWSWRIYHPDGLGVESPFPPNFPFPPLIDGDGWEFDLDSFPRLDDDLESTAENCHQESYFVATPENCCPTLNQFYQERGRLIEPLGQKERLVTES